MKAFLRPHRFRHLYPVRFYTTKTQSGHWEAFGGRRLKTPNAYFQLLNFTRYNALS